MRVLLIEDDPATAQAMELMLKSEGFNCYTTDLGQEGIDLAKLYDYDIILLDLNLPDISGFEVIKQLKTGKITTPIMVVSGLAAIEDKVKALNMGACDYMTKPFHKDEMVARIKAVVRRSHGHADSLITVGDLTVNIDNQQVKIEKNHVRLTPTEYKILEVLALRKGRLVTKEMLLDDIYGDRRKDEPDFKIINVLVSHMRSKLRLISGGQHFIETVWGRGFVLCEAFDRENCFYSPVKLNPVPAVEVAP